MRNFRALAASPRPVELLADACTSVEDRGPRCGVLASARIRGRPYHLLHAFSCSTLLGRRADGLDTLSFDTTPQYFQNSILRELPASCVGSCCFLDSVRLSSFFRHYHVSI